MEKLAPPRLGPRPAGGRTLFFLNAEDSALRGQDFGVDVVGMSLGPAVIKQCGPDVEAIADFLIGQIVDAEQFGPYLLAGYCFGGIVAYEVARKLVEAGCTVECLLLIEAPHPEGIGRLDLVRVLLLALTRPAAVLTAAIRRASAAVEQSSERSDIIREYLLEDHLNSTAEATSRFAFRPYRGKISLVFGNRSRYRFFACANWRAVVELGLELHLVAGGHDLGSLLAGGELARLISSKLK